MAVVLRLSRAGAKKAPYFHIVAADSRNARDGRFLEAVGSFHPGEDRVEFESEKLERWLKNGATPSDTVRNLIKRFESGAGEAPEAPKAAEKAKPAEKAKAAEKPAEEAKAEEKTADEAKAADAAADSSGEEEAEASKAADGSEPTA